MVQEFYVHKDKLIERQKNIIHKLNVFGFKGSTDIREYGEHIFGRSYKQEYSDDARFRPKPQESIIRIWNNGMSFHAFFLFRKIFHDYIPTFDSLPIPA